MKRITLLLSLLLFIACGNSSNKKNSIPVVPVGEFMTLQAFDDHMELRSEKMLTAPMIRVIIEDEKQSRKLIKFEFERYDEGIFVYTINYEYVHSLNGLRMDLYDYHLVLWSGTDYEIPKEQFDNELVRFKAMLLSKRSNLFN